MIASQPGMILVAEAGTGNDGVEKFKVHRPDVTLMDLRLPDINGVDAISKIRTTEPGRTHHRTHNLPGRRSGGACAEGWRICVLTESEP